MLSVLGICFLRFLTSLLLRPLRLQPSVIIFKPSPTFPDCNMAPRTRSLVPYDSPVPRCIFENIIKELAAASQFKELIYENITDHEWLLLSESLANHSEVERRHPR